ncbi:hypothetical protein GCK32_017309 [Trichostrongylus colubriformis]|uniref:G protein-coupled receptor n=1 Tax=Trichostrongylus colubriformis TaxID=6319 RepID=A0AAN8IFI7_TRICO
MSYVKVVTIVFHTICDSFGMLFNLTLLYLVAFRTPSQFKAYAILIGNSAVTDFVACFSACLIQQRMVPIKSSLIYFSHGPCRMIGTEFCYIMYAFISKILSLRNLGFLLPIFQALTIQAMLPVVFFVSVVCYGCAQIGFYRHPFLETFILMTLSTFPVLSPLISMYFIKPYRKAILNCLPRTLKKIAPSTEEGSAKTDVNATSAPIL